jgi:PPE-repeat protein
MVDFGALPPEINSARMYSGPGSSSLQAAASAWNGLAAELQSAAQGYETVITQLSSDEWMGPASASMASAAQPYVTWMNSTAAQAEQAATQARAAAAAYEQAFAATVPPPLIAANRAETAAATQANVFGQYTPLIMQLETQYAQMWAQDTAAMYGYAGQSASAAQVTPFASPAATTSAAGTATQAAAVSQATGTSAATSSQTILQELISLLPSNIQALLTPTGLQSAFGTPSSIESTLFGYLFGTTVLPTSLGALVTDYSPYASFFYNTEGLPYFSVGMGNFGVQMAKTLGLMGGAPAAAAAPAATGGLGGLGGMLGGGGGGAAALPSGVAANLGGAPAVGKLAVPPSWIGGAPLAAPHAPLPVSSVSAAPEGAGSGNLLGGMPLAGAGAGGFGGGAGPRYGFKPTVMARPPFAG